MPKIPHTAAGTRIDPAVSVPRAKSTKLPATADADPDDDPPQYRLGSAELSGALPSPTSPISEYASWSILAMPLKLAPASIRSRITRAVEAAGSWVDRQREWPKDDVCPSTAKRSLATNERPLSGPSPEPSIETVVGTRQSSGSRLDGLVSSTGLVALRVRGQNYGIADGQCDPIGNHQRMPQ